MSLPNLEAAVGKIRTYPSPPSGFDPRVASPLELRRRYGLPQPPDPSIRPELAERWNQVFSRKLTYILPTFRSMQELCPAFSVGAAYGRIW